MPVKKKVKHKKEKVQKDDGLQDYKNFVIKKLSHLTPYLQKAAMGDFSNEIKILKKEDEFTELSVSINLMIEDLDEMRNELDKKTQFQDEIIDNMSEGVYLIGLKDVKIKYANPKFEKMFGYESGEMIGKHASIVNAPTDKNPKDIAKKIMGVINKTGEWSGEVNNIKKDGTSFWSHANVSVFNHPEYGDILIAVHADITDRKKAEIKLKESEEFLNQIVEQSPGSTWISDEKGTILRQNQSCRDLFGIKKDADVIGKYNIFKDNILKKEGVLPDIKKVFTQGKVFRVSIDYPFGLVKQVTVPGAKHVFIEVTIFPIKNSQGKVTNAVVQHKDITKEKKVEIELEDSEEKHRVLYESSRDAIMTLEPPTWNFTSGNPATIKMFGVKDEAELISQGPGNFSPEKQPDGQLSSVKSKAAIGEAMNNGSNFFEWVHKRKDGEDFFADVLLNRVEVKGKHILQATVRDVTERNIHENELKEKIIELEKMNKLMIGRELKMVELKEDIKKIKDGNQ